MAIRPYCFEVRTSVIYFAVGTRVADFGAIREGVTVPIIEHTMQAMVQLTDKFLTPGPRWMDRVMDAVA